eukprot:CFRG4289T1
MPNMSGSELLGHLVGRCVELANEAGSVIREVQASRERQQKFNTSNVNDVLGATLKDAHDPRTWVTLADRRAQEVIIDGLVQTFGKELLIVAEEEIEDTVSHANETSSTAKKYTAAHIEYSSMKLEDICVFVDPVDGTREFVEGRLYACQTLIGISWRGRAIAGIMGLPFHDGAVGVYVDGVSEATMRSPENSDPQSSNKATSKVCHSRARGHVVYGVVGSEQVVGLTSQIGSTFTRKSEHIVDTLVVVTSECVEEKAIKSALSTLNKTETDKFSILREGGCGNKILRVITGQADVAFLNLASSLWDTCATEAILSTCNGCLTTLAGHPIDHARRRFTASYTNRYGVVATGSTFEARSAYTHAKWSEQLRALPDVAKLYPRGYVVGPIEVQSLDIARDIDGQPFTVQELRNILKDDSIVGFSSNEREAIRYKQSHACRIRLIGGSISSVFYKRTVLRELPYAVHKSRSVPYKIKRDVKSLQVEANFLAHPIVHSLQSSNCGFTLALPYHVQQRVCWDVPLDSRFTTLLTDLSNEQGWVQSAYLVPSQLKAALKALAAFHRFFWLDSTSAAGVSRECVKMSESCANGGKCVCSESLNTNAESIRDLANKLWTTGSYWHLGQQPAGQLERIVPNWAVLYREFGLDKKSTERENGPECDGKLKTDDRDKTMKYLGERLAAISVRVSELTHGIDGDGNEIPFNPQTIIHGDPKAPNFFFRQKYEGEYVDTDTVNDSMLACVSDTGDDLSVGVIDFQWSGRGLAATDVAYCIAASADPSCFRINDDMAIEGEQAHMLDHYLRYYHDCLGINGFEWHKFRTQFDLAFIDLGRIVIADHWSSITIDILRKRQGHFVFNAYNKSEGLARWFINELANCIERQAERVY